MTKKKRSLNVDQLWAEGDAAYRAGRRANRQHVRRAAITATVLITPAIACLIWGGMVTYLLLEGLWGAAFGFLVAGLWVAAFVGHLWERP